MKKSLCIYLFLLTGVLSFGQTTRYVNGSAGNDSGDCTNSSNPCSSIGYTIEQASSGDVIEIADGFYTESLFFSKSLTLIGESTTGTIIQAGEEPLSAWAFVSVIEIEEGVHLTLSNAHIRHGGAFQGGGIMNWGELTLSSAIVSDNEILSSGGGIYSVGPATLTDVIIRDNHNIQFGVGGGMICESGSTLTNVDFIGNSAYQAGGLQIQNESHTLKNLKFINNTAITGEGGGLVVMRATATLINALFQGNSAVMRGGAINVADSYFTMTNATISGNHSGGDGGGVSNREVFFDGELTMSNSIIWGNTADEEGNEIYNCETCVIYSLNNLYGNNPGDVVEGETFAWDNSLNEDPLFLNPAAGNFRLTENSPAIDAGDPDTDLSYFPGGPVLPVDLSGNPRVYNSLIDMGAYEYQGMQECIMPTDISVDNITSTTADISWTENGTATEWEIQYGEFGFTLGEGITITDNDGILGETISGLIPEVEYNAYVRSLCGENNSEWEGPIVFTTEQGSCIAPDSFTTGTITGTTAEFSWEPVAGETNGYNWVVMNFGESPGGAPPIAEGTTEPGITWATATGLAPNTLYFVYLQTNCDNGEQSVYGGAFMIMTIGGGGECIPPTDIIVNTVNPSMVYVNWTENGDATQWEIEYGETGFTQGEGTTILDNDGTPGEAISGLEEGTDYDVYVRAICEFSQSEWTGPVTFNTQDMGTNEQETQMVLYPNPTTGIVNIQTKEKINSVSVYNAAGQRVPFNSLNKENTSIDISSLPGGIYFIELNLNNKTIKRYKVIRK